MTMTFTRSLLATAVMVGLTACGSGGGGGSNAPTTSANNNQITVPNVPNSNNASTSNNNSSNNTDVNAPTTKIDMGALSGKATYKGTMNYNDTTIHSRTGLHYYRSGTFTLNADFDRQTVSGEGKLDRKQARSGNYRQIANSASLVFNETNLYRDSDGDIAFKGKAEGVVNDTLDATYVGAASPFKVSGDYEGYFSGNNAEKVKAAFNVESSEDSRVGAHGIMEGTKQ